MAGDVSAGVQELKDLCEAIVDCEHKTAPTQPQGIPSIRTTNISNGRLDIANANRVSEETYVDWTARLQPRPGDLILAREAPVGEVGIIPPGQRVCLGQRTVLIRADEALLHSRYLLYLLLTPEMRHAMSSKSDGCTVAHLNMSDIRKLKLKTLPGLSEQHAIAHILGTLDDKIELNQRMNETQEAITRAIFKSWFVDFDPVIAKADGRQPVGIGPETATLFPDLFVDSSLGSVPTGWTVHSVYDIADVIYGAPFKSSLFNENSDGKPLIRIRDLAIHNPRVFTAEQPARGYLVQPGDLVVGMDGEFRAYLWKGPEAWLNQRVCCFKSRPGIPRALVHYSIESTLDFFERSKTGTTVIHLSKSDIDTFKILVPPESLLHRFARIVDPMENRILTCAQESRGLADIRDTLLPKLISGEIRVKDAEKFV